MLGAGAGLLALGSAAALARGQVRHAAAPASVLSMPAGLCAESLRDQASPASCLEASSAPALGKLFPISEELYVSDVSGWVGIGNTHPFRPLEVVGAIGSSVQNGLFRAMMRPSTNGEFGVIETVSGNSPAVSNLISAVSIDTTSGAMATVRQGSTFLVTLSTPANNTSAGYVSVRNANAEIAGINGGTGVVFGASKSFVQPHPSDGAKEIQYVSLEGPEHGVYFRGSARLEGGLAVIETPESFRLVAREDGLTVSLTPLGASRGLYVARKGRDSFEVRENEGGSGDVGRGDVEFDFLVMGVRSALPEHVAIQANRHFLPAPGTTVREGELPGSYRELLIQNGTLNADGSVNDAHAAGMGWRREKGEWTGGRLDSAEVVRD